MGCRNNGLSEFWVVGIMLRIRFVSHLYSLSIMYMGHVLFPIFILCLSCTWAMFCSPSLFFVYHVHGPCFASHLYSLFIMYMGHALFPIFILCLSCTWAMFCFLSLFFVYHVHGPCFVSYLYSLFIMYMGHVLFQRIKMGNKTWPMYMINKE